MKPLVLFSSLAVLCAGGLAALSYKGLQDDPSALTALSSGSQTVNIKPAETATTPPASQQSAETKVAPAEKTAEKTAENAEEKTQDKVEEKPEEKVAAVAPEEAETTPSAEPAPEVKLGDEPTKPEAAEAEPEGASFDIVRVEEDGSAVLAGRAAPGSTVRLLINEKIAGETQANERGEWVLIPAEPMAAGAHQMQIETENAAGEVKLAEQSVALTVPDQPGTQPLIVLSETAKPSKVLQKPDPAEVKQAEATQESNSSESGEATAAAGQKPAAESKTAALEPSATATAPAATSTGRSLNVDVVDYNDAGLTTFSGRSAPGSTVRVYVDDVATGEAVAGSDGTWSFTAGREIASGPHTLRTDQIGTGGNVTERIELPFFRESAERIASLQAQRKTTDEEEQPKPDTAVTAAAEPNTTAKVAAAETQAEPAGTEAPAATETDPQDSVNSAEQTQAAEKPEMAETQQTSGIKGDAETVKPDVAPAAAEPDATQQTVAVEPDAEPAKPETAQQQVAAVEPDAEPVKPADLMAATEDDEPEEVARPEPDTASAEIAAVTSETGQAETAAPVTGKVVIQPGNNLWQISRVIYGQGRQYTVIYDANKGQIRDPNRIYPGQIFETPGSDAPESIDPACKLPLAECE
ncbi:MAG: Ig-like domain-containing protein [Anderseniella sp.]